MIKPLFVDTSGWMAMADGADHAHDGARQARDEHLRLGGILVSSDYVIDETLTLLRVRLGLQAAEAWWRLVDGSRRLRWARVDERIADAARVVFFGWRDKHFSFTDCTSFALMKELKLDRALTTDRHFAQAGFEVVP